MVEEGVGARGGVSDARYWRGGAPFIGKLLFWGLGRGGIPPRWPSRGFWGGWVAVPRAEGV